MLSVKRNVEMTLGSRSPGTLDELALNTALNQASLENMSASDTKLIESNVDIDGLT